MKTVLFVFPNSKGLGKELFVESEPNTDFDAAPNGGWVEDGLPKIPEVFCGSPESEK